MAHELSHESRAIVNFVNRSYREKAKCGSVLFFFPTVNSSLDAQSESF